MYKAVIIDDEENAVAGLELLVKHLALPIEIIGAASNAVEGLKLLKKKNPDIIFLDIEMHGPSGFDFLELADKKNKYFIFVTAHQEYAIKAIKNNINDYLLKPVNAEDLKLAIEKAVDFFKQTSSHATEVGSSSKLSIPTEEGTVFKDLTEVVYIKAKNRYSEIFCTDGSVHTVCRNIGEYENDLIAKKFFRVHKSYLVNCVHVHKINNIDGGFIELTGGTEVEISRRKKTEFLDLIKG